MFVTLDVFAFIALPRREQAVTTTAAVPSLLAASYTFVIQWLVFGKYRESNEKTN